jgi:hypothetical protein
MEICPYRVKNAGYKNILYIQVLLTNYKEIRNLYHKKKWSQWETHITWIYVITVLIWQKQNCIINSTYTHHMYELTEQSCTQTISENTSKLQHVATLT